MRYPETAALIKQARLKKGLSQEKAARRIGCSRLQWINWEQGLHRPEKYAASLVEVIGVDADKLSAADGGDLDQEALGRDLAAMFTQALDRVMESRYGVALGKEGVRA
jgi:transcriptional regulator with XRE-family HTH domain